MRSQSTGQKDFALAPSVSIGRSRFDRSKGHTMPFSVDYLYPFFVDEVLPADTFDVRSTIFARLATPLKPLLENLYLDTFYFFVPNRLVQDNWVRLMGERPDPDDDIDFTTPIITTTASTGVAVHSLYDYLGVPPGVPDIEVVNLLARAYNLIWNEHFRPQDICDRVVVDKDDGPDDPADYVLLKRAKRHDYFTSCLPWPQKGDEVMLPLGDSAPVVLHTALNVTNNVRLSSDHSLPSASKNLLHEATTGHLINQDNVGVVIDPNGMWVTDLSVAVAPSINDFREAMQYQKLLERDARGGTRYTEMNKAHFNVINPDARLQRPEYLGGGTHIINLTPVPQQSATGATGTSTPQGNLSAFGVGIAKDGFVKSFTEHGHIIGLLNVRSDLRYAQGLHKMFQRRTREEFYFPVFANLGEQAVKTIEIYAQDPTVDTGSTGTPDNDKIFGYQERWAEMRYAPNTVCGIFRPQVASSLKIWHCAQEFSGIPTLDPTFILESVPLSRCIAVSEQSSPQFFADIWIRNYTTRAMPVFSVPGLVDHN